MGAKLHIAVLVAGSLVFGCSKSSPVASVPQKTAAAARRNVIRPPRGEERTLAVVHAAHMESLPADEAPSLLNQKAGIEANDGYAAHPEADRALSEAVNALRTKLAVISHNLANADTVAFKRSRVLLEDGEYQQIRLPGAQDAFNNYAPLGIAVGHGCRIESIDTDFSQGPLETTKRELDLAIDGDGFFQVIDPSSNEFLYTRAGSFAFSSNGLLVIGSATTGRIVQPQISIPIDATAIIISAEGNVSIQQFGQAQFSQIGQLQLARFLNPKGLKKMGEHLYKETLASGAAIFGQPGTNGAGTLRQNTLELSNVNLEEELRAWKTTERMLKTFEQLLSSSGR